MVHLRSSASRAARLRRAIERGYVSPKTASDWDDFPPPPPAPPVIQSFEVTACGDEDSMPTLRSSLNNALALIEIQNNTIARLTAQVTILSEWRK